MLKGSIDGKVILKPETVREMQADQVGVAKVTPGEYVERAHWYLWLWRMEGTG